MKIVVLGGTGFIGGAIVDSLISKGHEVKIGTRNTDFHNFQTNERINVEHVEYNSAELIENFIDGYDFVINCIANIHGKDMSIDNFRKVEVDLTRTIAQVCLNKNIPIIQLSSIIAFGRKLPDRPVDENFVGSDFEMIDKICLEREATIKEVFQDSNEFLILRPVPVIGSKDKGGTLRKIFDQYSNEKFPIVEGGLSYVTFIDKRDFGNAVELAINTFETIKGEILIVGGFSVNWIQIKQAFDSYYGIEKKYLSLIKDEVELKFGLPIANFLNKPRLFDDTKFRERTGFLPCYTLNDAIESYLSI